MPHQPRLQEQLVNYYRRPPHSFELAPRELGQANEKIGLMVLPPQGIDLTSRVASINSIVSMIMLAGDNPAMAQALCDPNPQLLLALLLKLTEAHDAAQEKLMSDVSERAQVSSE